MHKNKKHLKTTADFLATMILSLEFLFLFIIECKTRCTSKTELETRRLALKMANKYARMKWNDPILSKVVTYAHELVQCLHHAAVYDLSVGTTVFYLIRPVLMLNEN